MDYVVLDSTLLVRMVSYWIAVGFVLATVFRHCHSGDIQCYCNLPICADANNTCTVDEANGACFSEFLDYREIWNERRGCLHLKSEQNLCGNAPGSTGAPRSLRLCCLASMCNQFTHSILGTLLNATDREVMFAGDDINPTGNTNNSYYNHEVWFKAATIAVPICGAMILVMLVALAFKIVRSDHVNVDKFCYDSSNAAAEMNQYALPHVQEAAKKVPLLGESRQNCEDFRNFTSIRIHYGQNVNVLKDGVRKADKNVNVEYARVNEITSAAEVADNEPGEIVLDVRNESFQPVPSFSLNLDKIDQVSSCNLLKNARQSDAGCLTDKCSKYSE